jgi:CRISPR-associated exonuclease Cas4
VAASEAEAIPRLTLGTDPALVNHVVAREALIVLRDLRRRARGTTPFLLLAEALERLRVRPILATRSADQAARALANLDLLMESARVYSVRGLAQFARDLEADWDGLQSHDEARIDTSGEAIEIVTVHSSKGLEWPVVIPINTASEFMPRKPFICQRQDDTMHWVLGDVVPPAIADAIAVDDRESAEEHERLLYVAFTRAIDLLILPQYSWAPSNSWAQLLDLKRDGLPELDLSRFANKPVIRAEVPSNEQTAEKFAEQQTIVEAASKPVHWIRPSDADPDRFPFDLVLREELDQIEIEPSDIAGSAIRGLVLHKLMEELLTGEIDEDASILESRAQILLRELGQTARASMPDAAEMAATGLRTLALPAVAEYRSILLPEIDLYSSENNGDTLVAGRGDAVAYENDQPSIVFDWKSDVAPTDAVRSGHEAQLLEYLRAIGAKRGAVVYMTLGQVQWIEAS